jgi:hypothetical protein
MGGLRPAMEKESKMLESWVLEVDGRKFEARVEMDSCMGEPWKEDDGHGDVSEWTRRDKAPGEMVLCEDRGSKRYYDFAGAVKRARSEGWNAAPYYPPGGETEGQRAHKAALADFNRLKDYCAGDWYYVGVMVAPVCTCCGEADWNKAESLWGIESDAGDYLKECAKELAYQVEPESVAA